MSEHQSEDLPDLDQLLSGVARLDFYVVDMKPTNRFRSENSREHLFQHMAWLQQVQDDGTLFLCGPVEWDESWDGTGLGVIRAESPEHAAAVVEKEPYHVTGLRQNSVRRWTVNEGSLLVRIDLLGSRGQLT